MKLNSKFNFLKGGIGIWNLKTYDIDVLLCLIYVKLTAASMT